MSDIAAFRTALNAMLTSRFHWYRRLTDDERSETLDAVSAMANAHRATIQEQAQQVARDAERAKRLAVIELPCFACGDMATRRNGQWFDDVDTYEAWIGHHEIDDSDEDNPYWDVRHELSEVAHGDEGAHARCALIAAVREAQLTQDYPAHEVKL